MLVGVCRIFWNILYEKVHYMHVQMSCVATSKEIIFEGIAIHNKCVCVCVCPLKIGLPLQIYDTFFVNLTVD